MKPLVKEGLILFSSIGLGIFFIFLTIIGLFQTHDYLEYKREYYGSQPRKGALRIDSVIFKSSVDDVAIWNTGKGTIISDPAYKFSVALLNFEYYQLEKGDTWQEYLIRNDSILPVWYNTTGWFNIDEGVSIEMLKVKIENKIQRLFLLALRWFVPLFLYILFFLFKKKLMAKKIA